MNLFNDDKNPNIIMVFLLWVPEHQKYPLIKSLIVSPHSHPIYLPFSWYLGIIPSIMVPLM